MDRKWAAGLLLLLLAVASSKDSHRDMISLRGGRFTLGTDAPDGRDGEGPARSARVEAFLLDKYPVSNQRFLEFVRDSKYKT